MTQATLQAFYIIYTTTYVDARQATKCETGLKQAHGVDTNGDAIGNAND